jgi:hypothetical protein
LNMNAAPALTPASKGQNPQRRTYVEKTNRFQYEYHRTYP